MYKTYFRQAVGMLKQNPFISVISILGTALAIMMIMTMIVTFQIKNASVAPEAFRDRTLYLVSFAVRDTSGGNKSYQSYGGLPYDALKNYIVPAMKTPELVVATVNNVAVVKREGAKDALYQSVRGTDADYWKLYTHTFTAGKPYAREDFESGIRTAVLSETMAKMLFKGEDPIGKNIEIDFNSYRVTGIVRNVSPLFQEAYSEVWIPYTASPGYERSYYDVMLLARNTADFPKIREEVNEAKRLREIAEIRGLCRSQRPPGTGDSQRPGNYFGTDKRLRPENAPQNRFPVRRHAAGSRPEPFGIQPLAHPQKDG